MRIIVDLDTQKIVLGIGISSEVTELRFKRAPSVLIEVQFTRNGEVVELDGTATGIFGVKRTGKYDDDYVTSSTVWVKSGTGTATVYSFTLSLINPTLDALFFVDTNLTNDVETLTLMAELQWIVLGNVLKTPTLQLFVANDVVREYDSEPPDYMFDDIVPDAPTVMLGDDNQPLLNG